MAPIANPAPTPNVPKTPGSNQRKGPLGFTIYEAVPTKSPPEKEKKNYNQKTEKERKIEIF